MLLPQEEEESTEVDSLDNQLGAVVSKLDEVSQYKRESEARWNENRRKVNEIQRQREAKAKAEAKHLSSQEKIVRPLNLNFLNLGALQMYAWSGIGIMRFSGYICDPFHIQIRGKISSSQGSEACKLRNYMRWILPKFP